MLKIGKCIGILLLLVLLSFPGWRSLLHPGLFTAHDLGGHAIRLIEFTSALSDGQVPVRWSKRLNWGRGYPYFNFNYPLLYCSAVGLLRLGFTYTSALKFLLFISFPFSGFWLYMYLHRRFTWSASLAGALLYIFIPYHFVNVYVRGNPAEAVGLSLVPLVFYFLDAHLTFPSRITFLGLTFSLSALVLIHNPTALIFCPVFILYALGFIFVRKSSFRFFPLLFPVAVALLLTAFFWLPALYDARFVRLSTAFSADYPKNFVSLRQLLYSPWGFAGSNSGPGQMSFQLGLPHWGILALSVMFLVWRLLHRQRVNLPIFFLSLSFISIFLMLPVSTWVWQTVSPLQFLQFPWRFLGLTSLCLAFLGAYLVHQVTGKLFSPLVVGSLYLVLLFFNRHHWFLNQSYSLPPYWLTDSILTTTTTVANEHTPIWQVADTSTPDRYYLSTGSATLQNWRSHYHRFSVTLPASGIFVDNTVYFPGWLGFIDGRPVPLVSPTASVSSGLLAIPLPAGTHLVETRFRETSWHLLSDYLSLAGLALLLLGSLNPTHLPHGNS